jgi:predicted GTPase
LDQKEITMEREKILIMGAAGRDFHNFNVFFRKNPAYEVVAFTATQIPGIEGRTYPPELAGEHYPKGIRIEDEADLLRLIKELKVDQVVFSYSDVSHEYVMHKASQVLAAGADFRLLGPTNTQVKSTKPVISVCASRTGCGKSQTTRHVARVLRDLGLKTVSIRHPMPYGDLAAQSVQRFGSLQDLVDHKCTIEEMEEYEPHIAAGAVIYAGVDYEAIVREAEKEADVILWDGGNNDMPFYQSDLAIVVVDPLRVGHESSYYPGESNVRSADVLVINKIDAASAEDVFTLRDNLHKLNPTAVVVEAASTLTVDNPELLRGKRALVVEDGPTLTHGGMKWGAGIAAAKRFGAAELIDPRPFAVDTLAETFRIYPKVGSLLPAMGYGDKQVKDLEATIEASDADVVVIGTPIDLNRIIKINKPTVRVEYELQELGSPNLVEILKEKFAK